jgi:hypothetical protein
MRPKSAALFPCKRLDDGAIALERGSLHVERHPANGAELLAAAGTSRPAMDQLREGHSRGERLPCDLGGSEDEAAVEGSKSQREHFLNKNISLEYEKAFKVITFGLHLSNHWFLLF